MFTNFLSTVMYENNFTEDQIKNLGEIKSLRSIPTACQLEDGCLEIATSFVLETVAGRKESLKAYPIRSGIRGGEYMHIIDKNVCAFLELTELLFGLQITETCMRYHILRTKYTQDVEQLVAEHNGLFELYDEQTASTILVSSKIEACEAYCFECKPWLWDSPILMDKLKVNNLNPDTLNFTMVVKPETNAKWTHSCYVYLNTNNANDQLLFSFGRDFDAKDPNDEIHPLNYFFSALCDKLYKDNGELSDKIVALLKNQIG